MRPRPLTRGTELDLDDSLPIGARWRDPRSPEPRSIVEFVRDGTLDASLAALLWLLVEARVPLVVAAGPSGTGKSTLLHALLAFLPPDTATHEVAGYAEDFAWLPEAASLGWRPHGFAGLMVADAGAGIGGVGGAGAAAGAGWAAGVGRGDAPGVTPGSSVLLVHEFSDHLPIYTWGEPARIVIRALSLGYGLAATIHAETLEEVLGELGGEEVGLTDDERSRLGVVLVLRALRLPGSGAIVRRVVAAHYIRPVARDAAGHVQRLGPAVLATWDPAADRFEDFAWGVAPELAERVGRRAGDLEAERDRRAAYLDLLVRSRLTGMDELAAALAHYRLAADGADTPHGPGGAGEASPRVAMDVLLETDRLLLRRFTPDDVELVTALDSDPAVMRFINGGRPTPRDEIRDDYLPAWLAYYERGVRWGFWAAVERGSGDFLGWFHLRPGPEDAPDEPELGYRLKASAWGRGLATEGSRALLQRAFEELGARRVYATTMAVNVASWRVMEKAGLRYVRTFHQPWPDRIEGEEQGDVEYALTREEWLRAQRSDT